MKITSLLVAFSMVGIINAQQPTLLFDCNPNGNGFPDNFTALNQLVLFSANDSIHGQELWVTDGTTAGTQMLKDINTTPGASSIPTQFTPFNGKVYFNAFDATNGSELWQTDGTAAGTQMVKNIASGINGSRPMGMAVYNNKLYFQANDNVNGAELWVTDGTSAGTVMLKDVNPNSGGSSYPAELTVLNNRLFFSANDGTHGAELWMSDGTAGGTQMVKDIYSTIGGGSNPSRFTPYNGKLYFNAVDSAHGNELWCTDGTTSGTQMVKDIHPVSNGSAAPTGFFVFNNQLFFSAIDGVHGRELWTTDGTAANTMMVKDLSPTGDGVLQSLGGPTFTLYQGKLFFNATDGVHGNELWYSDGTAAGTQMLKDINPTGNATASRYGSAVYNGKFYFIATATSTPADDQLYVTDGTADSTKVLTPAGAVNISPLFLPNAFVPLKAINGSLYFYANYNSAGWEPYILTTAPTGVVDVQQAGGFAVYPNPTSGLLHIRLTPTEANQEVFLYDATGRLVVKALLLEGAGVIDLGMVDPGFYWVTTSNRQQRIMVAH
ncbi:MAG: ELWxxDGT repeat protein [Chitinophagales bacterium]